VADPTSLVAGLRAVIVPHAGYVYSGLVAAYGYQLVAGLGEAIRHVILVGPAHRVGIRGIALPEADALATPLGQVRLWPEAVRAALAQPLVSVHAGVHAQEHSLEVQLPFLQVVAPQVDVLPLAAGWVEPQAVTAVIDAVWSPDTLVVISTDLSHYHPYDQAQAIDRGTIRRILSLDPKFDHDRACGATGVSALLLSAQRRQLTPHLLAACNSGDTAGDRTAVVGYASFAFTKEP
jgi:AmmeMemoRadiSam system protein B